MKKLITFIVLLLIAIALVAPKFAGNTFHQQVDNYVAAINQTGVYTASVSEREQGWFSSDMIIELGINMSQLTNAQTVSEWKIDLKAQAQHGPILTQNGLGLGWLDWRIEMLSDELPATLRLEEEGAIYGAQGYMSLFGTTVFEDKMPALNYNDPALNLSLSTSGWQGSGEISQSALNYQGSLNDLSMSMPNVYELNMSTLALSSDMQGNMNTLFEGRFYDGSGSFSVDKLHVKNLLSNEDTHLTKAVIDTTIDFDESAGLADILMQWSVDELSTGALSLNDLILKTEFNNLQEAFFLAYQDMNKAVMQSPERAQEIMQSAMEEHLLGQLQAEPEFNITSLSGVLNGGEMNMSSSNKIVGVETLPDTLESNDFWFEHLRSDSNMKVQESAALFIADMVLRAQLAGNPQLAEMDPAQLDQVMQQQSAATLNGLVEQGLLLKSEDAYSMSFKLEDGKAMLNSNEIPLPQ